MKHRALPIAFLLFILLPAPALGVQPNAQDVPICFWSDQGPVCVTRPGVQALGADPTAVLRTLLAGPTPEERARGLYSAIPAGTTLTGMDVQPDRTIVVRLDVPAEALRPLDPMTFEIIVEQIGGTLEPLQWSDLRIQTRDPTSGTFVPLASFLPELPAPRKETVAAEGGEEIAPPWVGLSTQLYIGQPPAPGQGQPQGALSGKTVYVSGGHGWQWNSTQNRWRTQRPPYPTSPYVGPIIEDHNNAEAVNQYLLWYLWNAGARVTPVRERDMNATAVMVDNDNPSPGTYAETGFWMPGSGGYRDTSYRYATTVTSTATATATWTIPVPADGRYAIYAWYRQETNRVPDARYTVHHAGGRTEVAVDQRVHGNTWHYLGTYGFRSGEVATVTLSNLSAYSGRAVIADAVRLGGGTFSDLTEVYTTAAAYPPNKPWWEVGAFYHVQRMGMNPSIWPYFNDIVARPMYARWEHAGTGEDAVYISWHTNGASAGYQTTTRGTMSIIYNGEVVTKPVTPGSAMLRDAVHNELVSDIRVGWDPTWPGTTRQMNLGELRELWDDDPTVCMPGALIEIAYHDHPGDTDALKEPTFEMLAARAIYQGIVKYFETRDGIDLPLLPEPPTHLAVRNVGNGRVQIAWRPSPTDTVGLRGDPATGYRVYTSTNGIGWSNGVAVAGTTVYTLAGLAPGQLVFVRVTATNAGGESFPTETLAVRVGDGAGVLIVNGFDRLNRTMLIPESDPVEGYNLRMFLDRMNRYDYVIQHGAAITYPFDSASNEAVQIGLVRLSDYVVADWILGEESTTDETLNATEQALVRSFLDGGGALFISGAEIGYDLDYLGSTTDRAFYNTVLRASYAGDDAGTYAVAPVAGSIFNGLALVYFDADGMYDADYPDVISPANGSAAALTYFGETGGTAAVQYADGCRRLVYFGFPFETIRPESRPAVMARVMGFLDECLPVPVGANTVITTPTNGSAYNIKPPFGGTAEAWGAALQRVEVQIERSGQYWTGSGWGTATWLTATGTAVWTYTLPTLTDAVYTLRARAWASGGISDTTPAQVTFTYDTISPTATTLITPTGGISFTAVLVRLEWQPVAPDSGSPLAYTVRLDDRVYTTTQSVYTVTVSEGPHVWGVQVFDTAGNRSAWVTDTFYASQHHAWLPLVLRDFVPPPSACADAIVNGGFETDDAWLLNRATYTTTLQRAGARSALTGILPGQPGGGSVVFSSVRQPITLPMGATATLRLYLYPVSENQDPEDFYYVSLYDQAGNYRALATWRSNEQEWVYREYDLSPYLGQRITLYVGTKNDGDDDTAALYADDVVLEVCP